MFIRCLCRLPHQRKLLTTNTVLLVLGLEVRSCKLMNFHTSVYQRDIYFTSLICWINLTYQQVLSTLYPHALANTNFFTRSGSGLQIGFYLERAGRDYVIFERDGLAGENFETFYAFYVIPFLFPLLDTLQRLVSTVSYRSSGREQYKFRKFSPAIASIKVSIAIIWALFNTRESA